ncbi:MAG: hypothetical protein E7663_01300 [Ruminococcaceae bacterium]|nr:hypothetical protein [Oscillospiraceae bacterium]
MLQRKRKRIAAVALVIILVGAWSLCASLTYSSYYTERRAAAEASLATIGCHYNRGKLLRSDVLSNDYTSYALSKEGDTIVLTDLQPNDMLKYFFSVDNFDADGKKNEIPVRVTVTVAVHLERLVVSDGGTTEVRVDYYAADVDHDQVEGMQGAELVIRHDLAEMTLFDESDFLDVRIPVGDRLSETDYTGNLLCVKEEGGAVLHSTGFYFSMNDPQRQKGFMLEIRLPRQIGSSDEEGSGRLCVDIRIDMEQVQQ